MKKLFILILILCSLTACSQTVTQYIGTKTNTVLTQGSHKVDSLLYLPGQANRAPSWAGAIRYNASTQKGQIWNGTSWEDIGTGTLTTNKVDSVTFVSSATVDTVKYWINGTATTAGYIDRKEGLISGGVVSWASGLTFDVTAAVYHLQGVRYTSAAGSITLNAADATHPRIDVIALNTSGQIVKITGTPAASPAEPQIDPATQVFLTSVHVAATATTPTGVSRLLVYDENTEWTGSTTGTVSANFNGTTPSSGTKSTTISSWSNGAAVHYTGTSQTPGSYTTLKLRVRLSGPLSSNQNISVVFVNSGTVVSNAVNLTAYGFMKTMLSDYQTISIPMSGFAFSGTSFDRVQLNLSGNVSSTVNIDVVELQGGITQSSPTYTDAQARKAISLTTTGTSGAATYDNTTGVLNIPQYGGGTVTHPAQTKGLTIESPTSSENIGLWRTPVAITITQVDDVLRGNSTPSLSWQVNFAATRDGTPTTLFASSRTTTTTSGATTSTFNDATIPAGSFIWLTTSAMSGTVNALEITLTYTVD
jgi:hypothetical protein